MVSTAVWTGAELQAIAKDDVNAAKSYRLNRCENTGSIIADSEGAGGILAYSMDAGGSLSLYITNCTNSSPVTSKIYAGGILGFSNTPGAIIITACKNSYSVTATNEIAGGIVGTVQSN